ncbi:MAG: hypothetical protein JO062_01430 [Bryobacterales bacterium]|nr:hypothetical protein [Bryobacterales bacterium]
MRGLRISNLPHLRDAARTSGRIGYWVALFCVVLAACTRPAPPPAPTTGLAYAGPPTLSLRKDLGPRASIAATVKHGDRLDVLETRRRFVRVRTSAGVEGWTDLNLLLSDPQMTDLRALAAAAKQLPSEGAATVFEPLNIHAEPFRQSASFFQIPEKGSVEVIGHRVSAQHPPPAPKPASHRAAAAPKKKSKNKQAPFLLPLPNPPPVPPDLMDLSRPSGLVDERSAQPIPMDDWSLVRTSSGDVGWALSRMLVMSIPDEVAQYAEGRRITSYLPLGTVTDKEKNETKQNWLWTTASFKQLPYEFDSFRVFVWSLKHHRYETAYIERNVKGYYPVERVNTPGQQEDAFSLVLEDKEGKLNKCTYAFSGYRVHQISKVPYQPPPPLPEVRSVTSFEPPPPPPPAQVSWADRLRSLRSKLRL